MLKVLARMPPVDGLDRYLLFDQQCYLPDDILYKSDRMSMAHSLEVRPPFLDHRLVEFAASLPENYKLRGSKLKFLLKELMKDKLPTAILAPQEGRIRHSRPRLVSLRAEAAVARYVDRAAVAATQIFRWEGVQSVIKRHLDRRENLGYHLWGLLILFVWLKRWNIQTLSETASARMRVSLSAAV